MATRKGRGLGKTAFLNHQRVRIMADLGDALTEGSHILFAAHVCTPAGGNCRKFWQFARAVFDALNEQEVLAQLIWRLRVFSDLIPGPVLERAREPRETIGDDHWLVQEGVDVDRELTPAVQRGLVEGGVDPLLAEALARFGHSPERFRHNFLRFQSDYRWRQKAARWLSADLVSAFRVGQFTRGLFLIDDFEKTVLEQNRGERRSFADSIRYTFLDGPTPATAFNFYSFLWVINPYVQELLISDWNAAGLERFCALGGDRAQGYTLDFLPLSPEATVPLVMAYLDDARSDEALRGSLQPFSYEAITEASRLNGGLPGFLLQSLHFTTKRAVEEGWTTIGPEQVRQVVTAGTMAAAPDTGILPLRPPDINLGEDGGA
ncbi:MAG: hypothetical protein JO112_20510 [Planctomycetes bacterium]|nr:hypothetical protein [Planctomycetota bacterium]